MENYLDTLLLPTWDLDELRYFCERVAHKTPSETTSREELLAAILQSEIDPNLLAGALAPGNHKLGPGVRCFNLPPLHTCPGKSKECTRIMPDGH